MKLTKDQIKAIIKEEIDAVLKNEGMGQPSPMEQYQMLKSKLMQSGDLPKEEMKQLAKLILQLDSEEPMAEPSPYENPYEDHPDNPHRMFEKDEEKDEKEVGMNSIKNGYDKNPEVTKADFIPKKKKK